MKRLFTIFTILAAVILVSSCQKELPDNLKNVDVSQGGKTPASTPTPTPELKVSEPGQFGAKGGQQTITIIASEAWTLTKSVESDWLTVKTVSGKAGTTQVDLEAAENTLTILRTATITVSFGNLTKNVEISQSAANSAISLSVDSLNFASVGDSQSFSIKSNIAWTVTSSLDWCSVSPASGSNDGSVTVNVSENKSLSERSATITVESEIGNQTVKVIQSGAEPVLQLNKNDLSFTAAEGNDSFTITSNTSWAIVSDQTWCKLGTSSGSGNATVTVNVTENTFTSSRNATITVKAGDLSKTIVVTQAEANATLHLNKSSMSFESVSGSGTFTISSNTSWSITSDKIWCTLSSSSGSKNATVTVKVSENTSTSSRSATITVKAGDQSQTIAVTQSGAKATLQLSKTSMSFESSSGSNSFTITSNTSWSVTSNQTWCKISSSSGSDNGTITISVTENTSTSSRSATITVKAGDLSKTITVTQSGANPKLQLNKSSMSFESASGSGTFTISSNTSWSITSNQTWCTLSSSSGSNNSAVTVYASENTSTSSRSATITVKAGNLSKTIAVTQSGANATLQLNKSSMSFESASGSGTFTISSNTSWSITSNQTWCTLSSSSGSNNATVTVYVSENMSSSSRSATIAVKTGNLSKTIVVTQAGAEPVDESTRTFTANGVSFKMIRVDGGTFTMGATSEQGDDAGDSEKPAHQVTLSTYYIGETEVTQELWQAVMGSYPYLSNPSFFSGSRKPVEQVSWNDCQSFLIGLNALTGMNFRLPTEAEWEFAARGGMKSRGYKYAGSNTIDNVAWYSGNSGSQSHDVATKAANELGLYDMSGNVFEWCQDLYGSYSSSSQMNPTGSGLWNVIRGGGWDGGAGRCRVSSRTHDSPSFSSGNDVGLRLAL